MGERPKKADWPIMVAWIAAIALALLGIYVGGYYATGTRWEASWKSEPSCYRVFPTMWLARLYQPAAKVEAAVTGGEVLPVIEAQPGSDTYSFISP